MLDVGEPIREGDARVHGLRPLSPDRAWGGRHQYLQKSWLGDLALLFDLAANQEMDIAALVSCRGKDGDEVRLRLLFGVFFHSAVDAIDGFVELAQPTTDR